MKKSKIIIAVVAVLVVAVIAAVAVPLLMEERVPEGMVKVWLVESCRDRTRTGKVYEYDEEGNLTSILNYKSGELDYRLNYDKNGNVIEEIYYSDEEVRQLTEFEFDSDGKLLGENWTMDGEWWATVEYIYDEKGVLVEEKYAHQNDGESTQRYVYDDKGRLIEKHDSDDGLYYSCDYDESGNLVKEVHFTEGKEDYRYEYKYDEKNQITEKATFEYGTIDQRDTFEYDAEGRIINEKNHSFYEGEHAYYEKINEYDEDGRKLSMKESNEDGTSLTSFVYDKKGRLSKIDFPRDSRLDDIKCKYTYVIVTPEQAEKLEAEQKKIYDELVYDDETIID